MGCKGNLVLSVKKFLEILSDPEQEDPEVETRMYSYHARVKGLGRELGSIFQYDNHHPSWLYPGHKDPHHKHCFDWRTGEELKSNGSPEWQGVDNWPFMHKVLDELRDWYYEHYHELPNPNSYPTHLEYPR